MHDRFNPTQPEGGEALRSLGSLKSRIDEKLQNLLSGWQTQGANNRISVDITNSWILDYDH